MVHYAIPASIAVFFRLCVLKHFPRTNVPLALIHLAVVQEPSAVLPHVALGSDVCIHLTVVALSHLQEDYRPAVQY